MNKSLQHSFTNLRRALDSLEQIMQKPMQDDRSNIDAALQRFEYSIELFWKVLKKIMEWRGLEVTYPKDVLREAYAGKLIDDQSVWLQMLNDRNLTSHAYDKELAD